MADTHIVYGFHAVVSGLRQHAAGVQEIYLDGTRNDARAQDLVRLAGSHAVRIITVDAQRLDGLTGHARHQGVAARVVTLQLKHDLDDVLESISGPALLLVLDGVQDPHNLGACLRVADAAGCHAVIAPKDRAVGLSAAVIKVASGAADSVPYVAVTNLARTLRELKERNIWVVGAASGANEDLYSAQLPAALAWVLGAEGEGLRRLTRETCDQLLKIPMLGQVESLNVSVASGVVLFESRRRRSSRV